MSSKPSKTMDPDALEIQLRQDLETLKKYRELEARYGGKPPSLLPEQDQGQAHRTRRRKTKAGLIGTAERLLSDNWERFPAFMKRVQAERPKAGRAPLRNAVTRLVEQGVAEKQGDKTTGVSYRRKPGQGRS